LKARVVNSMCSPRWRAIYTAQ